MDDPANPADPATPAFKTKLLIRFNHADTTNTMFFGNVYAFAHQILERFIVHAGFEWRDWFTKPAWAAPFRRIDADHRRPHMPGTEIEVTLRIVGVDDSSFSSRYEFRGADGTLHTVLDCVNGFIDRRTTKPIAMPGDVRERLERQIDGTRREER